MTTRAFTVLPTMMGSVLSRRQLGLGIAVSIICMCGCAGNYETESRIEASSSGGKIQIAYIPFAVDTYFPVTIENIETEARCLFVFTPTKHEADSLHNLLSNLTASEGFNRSRVRLRILGLERDTIYVDAEGEVLHGMKSTGRVSNLSALGQIIESIARRMGCDPDKVN